MNDDSGKISVEICRQTGRHVFPLYHSITAPPWGRVVLLAVGEGGALPNKTPKPPTTRSMLAKAHRERAWRFISSKRHHRV